MRRWGVFTVLVLGLCVIASGALRPGNAAAYGAEDVGNPVHEYMMWAAAQLGVGNEVRDHLNAITDGASHEDVFDHVYDRTGACVTITHFWDPDNGRDSQNDLEMDTAFCSEDNAWIKARQLWGMALGEYYAQDYVAAYEYLGHVAHLLGDMTVPAHAHEDSHVYPDEFDDVYMTYPGVAELTADEIEGLRAKPPIEIPGGVPELYYLFYTTAQVGDFYASDDVAGDSDDPEVWADFSQLNADAGCRTEGGPEDGLCEMQILRTNSYFYGIRAITRLFNLFAETVRQQSELTVVIDSITQIQGHGATDDPDYFVNIGINDVWFTNEGSQVTACTDCTIDPGWAFARNAELSGVASVKIELWDDDDDGISDCHSDIYNDPDSERAQPVAQRRPGHGGDYGRPDGHLPASNWPARGTTRTAPRSASASCCRTSRPRRTQVPTSRSTRAT